MDLFNIPPIYCDFREDSLMTVETVDGRSIAYPETWKAFRVVHYDIVDDEERKDSVFCVYLDRLDREDVDGSLANDNPIAIYHGEADFIKAWSEIQYSVDNGLSFEMPVYCFADRQEKDASNAHRITGEILDVVREPYTWIMKTLDDLLAWYDCGAHDAEWLKSIVSELDSERHSLLDYSLVEKTIRAKTEKLSDIIADIVSEYTRQDPDSIGKRCKESDNCGKVGAKSAKDLPKLAENDDSLPF